MNRRLYNIVILFFTVLSMVSIVSYLDSVQIIPKKATACQKLVFNKGEIISTKRNFSPKEIAIVSCDYGQINTNIFPKTGAFDWLTCRFRNWQNTTAIFECIASEKPGLYVHTCQIIDNDSSSFCPQENLATTYQILGNN